MKSQLMSVAIMVFSVAGLIHEGMASAEEKDAEAVRAAARKK